jgi:PAS domain S-box-containing protein
MARPRFVRLSLSARRGDARGVVAGDIAELKLPEKEARKRGQSSAAADLLVPSESEKLFRSFAQNTEDAMARFDRKLRYLYVNPVVEKVTGMTASAFIGRTNRELGMPKENVALWDAKLRSVLASGQRTTLEFEYHSPEGMRVFSSLLVPELDENDRVESVLSVARDITEASGPKRLTARSRRSPAIRVRNCTASHLVTGRPPCTRPIALGCSPA